MARSFKDKVAEAKAAVPPIAAEEAIRLVGAGEATLVDVREDHEVASGRARGAIHASRGTLEFKANPEAENRPEGLSPDRTVILYCGGGTRAALAGQALKELGYEDVRNLGGLKDWIEAGGEVER